MQSKSHIANQPSSQSVPNYALIDWDPAFSLSRFLAMDNSIQNRGVGVTDLMWIGWLHPASFTQIVNLFFKTGDETFIDCYRWLLHNSSILFHNSMHSQFGLTWIRLTTFPLKNICRLFLPWLLLLQGREKRRYQKIQIRYQVCMKLSDHRGLEIISVKDHLSTFLTESRFR